jgi:D-glycero-beta-D-manno-heptose 1-phosphate adenylyltransferase
MIAKNKILSNDELCSQLAKVSRPVVMTNGVFDLIHRGHVSYLNDAAKLGSVLVVGINSDRSVRLQNKGPDRPINSDSDRAFVLAGLVSVDYVTFFDELTPIQLVGLVRPDIYVKGGDYQIEELDEAKLVKSWGGAAYSIPYIEGFSSTSLIHRIRNFEN